MIDYKRAKELIDECNWFYDIPGGYSYFEALENDYEIEPYLHKLDSKTIGVHLLSEVYDENKVEIEDYLTTLEAVGDTVEDVDYRCKLFLNYFANIIARRKLLGQRSKIDLPEWVEFTINI